MNWGDFLLPNGKDDFPLYGTPGMPDAPQPTWQDKLGRVMQNVRFSVGKGNKAFGFDGNQGQNQELRSQIMDLIKQQKGIPAEPRRNVRVISTPRAPQVPGLEGLMDGYNPMLG